MKRASMLIPVLLAAIAQATYPAEFTVDRSTSCVGAKIKGTYFITYSDFIDGFGTPEIKNYADIYCGDDFVQSVILSDDGTSGYTASYEYTASNPGEFVLGAEIGDADSTWAESTATWAKISFTPTTVRVGVGKTTTVTSVVTPASVASSAQITFETVLSTRATVTPTWTTEAVKQLTLTGVAQSEDENDTELIGVLTSLPLCGSVVNTTVTIPTSSSEAEHAESPTMAQVPNTLKIQWGPANVSVTLYDQFGKVLDSSWNGSKVTETISGGVPPVNELPGSLNNGTIVDPCRTDIGPFGSQTEVENVLNGSDKHSDPVFPPRLSTQTLSVGSYSLSPVWTRTLLVTESVLHVYNARPN